MIEKKVSVAELILIAGTRVALGVGVGLLIAGKLDDGQRKSTGLALAIVGGLTTIPLAMGIFNQSGDETTKLAA